MTRGGMTWEGMDDTGRHDIHPFSPNSKVLIDLFQKVAGFQGSALNRPPQRAKSPPPRSILHSVTYPKLVYDIACLSRADAELLSYIRHIYLKLLYVALA